ncbi:DNA-binding transcriptional dual regulator CpxR [Candidatus Nitrotoga sp. BS]|uniref:response regulator transcription factor n=1 Tax=Candidatus Nitrotoga sp. BS TaxID=2890408 RepID=UPI001EF17397|nr:response regulator transcription factor [Candidatus Nitrotoga sp. BS]CAH1205315.1 DNA-binding transcriptional dual regulator CpxR [Candidatus Nitrotoga sp. BS]
MTTILLIDDDKEFCLLLKEFFKIEDMEVTFAHDGKAGIEAMQAARHDVVVLDIMMPPPNGIEVLKKVRPQSNVPIIMLTARGEDIDRIVGLELGADDYLSKPCNPRELLARIRAVLRRTQLSNTEQPEVINAGQVTLNTGTRTITVNGKLIELTSTQFSVLEQLMRHAGKVITKEDLTEKVLDRKLDSFDRSIDMHVSNIRKVLNRNSEIQHIKTIRNVGYQFVLEQE